MIPSQGRVSGKLQKVEIKSGVASTIVHKQLSYLTVQYYLTKILKTKLLFPEYKIFTSTSITYFYRKKFNGCRSKYFTCFTFIRDIVEYW